MVKITIEFPTEQDRDEFLGQVSDGAMENMCDITPLNPEPTKDGRWQKAFGGATEFKIEMEPRENWF
jgi:hypothetical protein